MYQDFHFQLPVLRSLWIHMQLEEIIDSITT